MLLCTLVLSSPLCLQERVLQARKLNATKRQELLFKRMAALQEVLEGARPLVRALKEERKARVSICYCCWGWGSYKQMSFTENVTSTLQNSQGGSEGRGEHLFLTFTTVQQSCVFGAAVLVGAWGGCLGPWATTLHFRHQPALLVVLRCQQTKKGSTTSTKVSRLLDAALGESIHKQPAKSLESALQAFDDITGSSSSSSSSSSSAAAQAQALAQQQLAAEPWVANWTILLSRARATLASSLLLGGELGESGGSSGVGSSDSAEAAAELEQELQALRQKEKAEAGECVCALFRFVLVCIPGAGEGFGGTAAAAVG